MARGEAIAQGIPRLEIQLPDSKDRSVVVDVRAEVSQPLFDQLVKLGAELLDVSATYRNVRLRVDLGQIEAIAALPQVVFVQPKQEAITSRVALPLDGRLSSGAERVRAIPMVSTSTSSFGRILSARRAMIRTCIASTAPARRSCLRRRTFRMAVRTRSRL
jgi:hypothetical protein